MDSGLSHDEASELFDQVLEQGIIDKRNDGEIRYLNPFHATWLLNEYAKEKTADKASEPKDSQAPDKFQKSRLPEIGRSAQMTFMYPYNS